MINAQDIKNGTCIRMDGKLYFLSLIHIYSAQAREAMGKHGKKPVVHYDYLYIE